MTSPAPRVRLPIADALQVSLTYDVNGQPAVVVVGCAPPDDGGFVVPSDALALAQLLHTNMRPLMATSCTLVNITARETVADGQVFSLALPATNLTGTAAGNLITAYATLVRWKTARGGRSGQGRTYVPGFTTANVNADGRTLSSSALTAANALGTAMVGATGPSGTLAVLSFTDGVSSAVTGHSVSPIVGIQRRRLRN